MQKAIKNTAAVLHPLHEKDREWILSNLSSKNQRAVRHALSDLKNHKSFRKVSFDEIYELVKPTEVKQHDSLQPEPLKPDESVLDTFSHRLGESTVNVIQHIAQNMSPESLVQLLAATEDSKEGSKLRRCISSSSVDFSNSVALAEKHWKSQGKPLVTPKVLESLARYFDKELVSKSLRSDGKPNE